MYTEPRLVANFATCCAVHWYKDDTLGIVTTSRLKEGERERRVVMHGPFEDGLHFCGYIIHRYI